MTDWRATFDGTWWLFDEPSKPYVPTLLRHSFQRTRFFMTEPSNETEARRLAILEPLIFDLEVIGLDADDAKRTAEAVSGRLAEVVIDASAVGSKMPPGIADSLDVGLAMALSSTFIALGRNPPAKVTIDRETPFGQDRRVRVKVERA